MTATRRRLDARGLQRGVAHLIGVDRDLAAVVRQHGPPPLWARRAGFATLIRIVLEQQVSLASARAVYRRLTGRLGRVTPTTVARWGVTGLRRLGVTRQKATCCVGIAARIAVGDLDLPRVGRVPVERARRELLLVKGIGPWTADIYLLMALRQPDIWPTGDLALLTALQGLRELARRPTVEEAAAEAAQWAPWRAVAARILWHGYLEGSLGRSAH